MFFFNITLHLLSMPVVYSRPYVYSFWQIFQALRLIPVLHLFRTLEYKEQPIQLLNTTFPQIILWICWLKKMLYRNSSYSFRGNYSFLNLEIVENSNSCCNISNFYLINWFFAAVIRNEDLALNFPVMRNRKFKKHLLFKKIRSNILNSTFFFRLQIINRRKLDWNLFPCSIYMHNWNPEIFFLH